MAMIAAVEDYFTLGCGRCDRFATTDCSARKWSAGLDALRAICQGMGLQETVKWGHPCYMHADYHITAVSLAHSALWVTNQPTRYQTINQPHSPNCSIGRWPTVLKRLTTKFWCSISY
jgi:hypothetical protein